MVIFIFICWVGETFSGHRDNVATHQSLLATASVLSFALSVVAPFLVKPVKGLTKYIREGYERMYNFGFGSAIHQENFYVLEEYIFTRQRKGRIGKFQ